MAPRILLLLLACVVFAACGDDGEREAASTAASTQLTVTVDADGDGPGAAKRARVRCDDGTCAGGVTARALEPISAKRVCTDIFGGPDTAEIEGTLRGEAVSARFTRANGCEIERWDAARPLLDRAR